MKNTARQVSPMSASPRRSRVRHIERTKYILNTYTTVRQTERIDYMTNTRVREGAAGGHRGLAAPGAAPDRAVAHRGGPPGRDRQVHALPAGVRDRQPQRGDAVGDLRRAGRAVLPSARPAPAAHPGDPGPRGSHGGRGRSRLPGHPAGRLPAGLAPRHLPDPGRAGPRAGPSRTCPAWSSTWCSAPAGPWSG